MAIGSVKNGIPGPIDAPVFRSPVKVEEDVIPVAVTGTTKPFRTSDSKI